MPNPTKVDELEIPPTVFEHEDADEFLRFWVAGGDDHVTLRSGVFGESELESWGMILADVARHVVTAHQDNNRISTETAYAKIAEGYSGRLAMTIKLTTTPLRKLS
jgi:hypothetical protein